MFLFVPRKEILFACKLLGSYVELLEKAKAESNRKGAKIRRIKSSHYGLVVKTLAQIGPVSWIVRILLPENGRYAYYSNL